MYSVKSYKDVIESKDAETQKRYRLIEKLSKGFVVSHPLAQEMDSLLAQQLSEQPTVKPKSAPASRTKPSIKEPDEVADWALETTFQELFNSLKELTPPTNITLDKQEVYKALKEALQMARIGYDDLDTDLQKRLSASGQVIRYELPDTTTPSFKKPPIAVFQQIVDDVVLGQNVFLVGGAGTGKTYLAEQLISGQALGRKHVTINCSQWTSPTEIIGGQTMDGYQEGKLIEAWKNGWILILDELPKIDPNTAGLLNDALAKTKVPNAVIFNSRRESFTKHAEFACIATGNIYPDKESMSYGANNKQDLSLLDRFSGSVYFIEKNPEIERTIVQNDMIWSICDAVRSAIEEYKYEAQLSLRFMENARDAYLLETKRAKGKNGIQPSEGKTLKSTMDNYLSTFTEIQRQNLKTKIRYPEVFNRYVYREFDTSKLLF